MLIICRLIRYVLWVCIHFSLFCGALNAYAEKKRAVKVVVGLAQEVIFYDRVEALGTLRANESVELTVNVSETITAIHFNDGQYVNTNDILVEMTSAEEQALLEEAQSNAHEAKLQLDRVVELVRVGTASQSLLNQRQRDYSAAKARLLATQSRLKDRIVRAPFSGNVGLRNVSVGALVRPGDIITTLTDNRRMKLDFSVPSVFLTLLKKQLPVVSTTRAYTGRTFEGHITSIDNQVDPVTRSITVRAMLPNEGELLKQGMLMNIELMMNERKAIVIPESALIPRGRKNYVMVVDENATAQQREVDVAARRLGEVEITTGLVVGEKVVSRGAFKVKPGSKLDIQAPDERLPTKVNVAR